MRALLFAILLFALVGCGYHFPGKSGELPGGVKKIYLPLFVNRSAEPQLENQLSNDMSRVFSRNATIELVEDRQQAEAVVEGTITGYSSRPLSYDRNDDISEYRAQMTLNVRLRQLSDGRLLWQGDVSWADEYRAADDKTLQEDLEQEAIKEISSRISEELMSRMLDDF